MKKFYKLRAYFVIGPCHQGSEVLDEDYGYFATKDDAAAMAKSGCVRSNFEESAPESAKERDLRLTAIRYDIVELMFGGDRFPKKIHRYDASCNFLGTEFLSREDKRIEAKKEVPEKPRFAEGDVVATVAYGRLVAGVVVAVPNRSDPEDDDVYLVNYGICVSGGTDHVHPGESEILPLWGELPDWLLNNLSRLSLTEDELSSARSRLKPRG